MQTANTATNQNNCVEGSGDEGQGGGGGRQSLSAGSQVRSKGQVFLPGEWCQLSTKINACVMQYISGEAAREI